jgi:hypothetical protein
MLPHNAAVRVPLEPQSVPVIDNSASHESLYPFPSEQQDPILAFYHGSDELESDEFTGRTSEPEASGEAVFNSKPKLPPSNVVQRSLGELLDLMNGPYLELRPEHSRDNGWSKRRMVSLIDSLIGNYYIPPIIFNMERLAGPDGTDISKRVCLDGRHRLSSIKAFMGGQIGCHDSQGCMWFYGGALDEDGKLLAREGRKTLPDHVKEEFRQKQLVCYEFLDLSKSQVDDLFYRVQLGDQPLPGGKLKALTGRWKEMVKEFENEYPTVIGCKSRPLCLRGDLDITILCLRCLIATQP